MKRYDILIADDEAFIRKGFIARLRHVGFEPRAIYEASDGADALRQIQLHPPDIVVADIRMPIMDGLAFIQAAREAAPGAEFIILSGYAEFAYAERAIQLGVHAYLVKPLSNEALADAMASLLRKLEDRDRVRAALARRGGEAQLIERGVADRLRGKGGAAECAALAHFLRAGARWTLAVVDLGAQAAEVDDGAVHRAIAARCGAPGAAEDALLTRDAGDGGQLLLLVRHRGEAGARSEAEALLPRLREALGPRAPTIGVSAPSADLSPRTLRQAREALFQRMVLGHGRTYWYADIRPWSDDDFPGDALALLQRRIDGQDLGGAEAQLRALFGRAKADGMPPSFFRLLWLRTVSALMITAGSPSPQDAAGAMLDFDDLGRFDSVDAMCDGLIDIVAGLAFGGNADALDGGNKVRMAVQHIHEHYGQNLSVNELAAMYGLSPNYFSTLFRREVGATVVNHIRAVRMENACRMLRETDAHVVDIAAHVGYADSQYFFRLFRKEMGLSPLQYRKACRRGP